MAEEPHRPVDTKEFVAGWQTIVEDHVVSDLAVALRKLVAADASRTDLLARHITHALLVAANEKGSVQAAVRYLCELADQTDQPGAS